MSENEEWVRYRHKTNRAIEYDVACHWLIVPSAGISQMFKGEWCFRIRTVRNLAHFEEVHQPAYTMMPADKFFEIYEVAA